MRALYCLPLFLLLVSSLRVLPAGDKVTSLPGWPDFASNKIVMYSGFVPTNYSVGSVSNGSIHYTFIQSLNNPSTDPVVLWLNGGPGCSSVFGLFQEIGPYTLNGTTWSQNTYTWLKNASILVLESPFGVGFSFNITNVSYDDDTTATYNYYALLNWFSSFSDFKAVPFWIAGESYAGMYIPFLSTLILNDAKNNGIKFKGIMIGNGVMVTDSNFNSNSLLNYLENHNLFSPQILQVLKGVCPSDPTSASCQFATQQARALLKRVNPYDIYGYCTYADLSSKPFPYALNFLDLGAEDATTTVKASTSQSVTPCLSSADIETYMSRLDVQTALHIVTGSIPRTWQDCSENILDNYNRSLNGSIVLYPQLIAANLRILIYSGDADSVVSYLNTQMALSQLNLQVQKSWRTWHISLGQVGGYLTQYQGLNFTVVRGAGHMVPQSQPEAAYIMFSSFLNDLAPA